MQLYSCTAVHLFAGVSDLKKCCEELIVLRHEPFTHVHTCNECRILLEYVCVCVCVCVPEADLRNYLLPRRGVACFV